MKKKPKTRTHKRPFNSLPEEIIINIFDKISDAKSLCLCSLVSKKFCSLVLETHIVSVKIPSWIRGSSFKDNVSFFDVSSFGTSASMIKFLMKFSRIESITIHLDFDENPVLEPLVKWSYDGYGFVFVSAETVGVDVEVDKIVHSDLDRNSVLGKDDVMKIHDNISNHFLKDFLGRFRILLMILAKFVSLKKVLLLDSMKEGRIFLNKEGMASMLRCKLPSVDPLRIKLWHTPLLHLPLTGCVVKEVTVIGLEDVRDGDENRFEDKLFSELAVVMMKKKMC